MGHKHFCDDCREEITGEYCVEHPNANISSMQMCDRCAAAGIETPATTRSLHSDWCHLVLCAPCAQEYDGRPDTWMTA